MSIVGSVRRRRAWLLAAPTVDGVLAVVLTVVTQAQLPGRVGVLARLLLLALTLLVALRRRHPLAVAVAAAALLALLGLTPDPPSVFGEYLTVMLTGYTVAERCRLTFAIIGGLALVGGVIAHDLPTTEYGTAAGIGSDLTIPTVIWAVGRVVHYQRGHADRSQRLVRQLEHDREQLARVAIAAERAHLARELHDVVTHSVSVVVIQAQGAQRVLDTDQPEVREALTAIETAGRTALTEMRRLLGLLRDEEQNASRPALPGLADLPALLRQVRGAGLPVELVERGARPELDPGLALSAYRVVQEALTNALKYAGQATADVELRYEPTALEVIVTDDGKGTAATQNGGGRGTLGMQERVEGYGGQFDAGPVPTGGYQVRARFLLPGQPR